MNARSVLHTTTCFPITRLKINVKIRRLKKHVSRKRSIHIWTYDMFVCIERESTWIFWDENGHGLLRERERLDKRRSHEHERERKRVLLIS